MRNLRQAFQLAQEMGGGLGSAALLLGAVQAHKALSHVAFSKNARQSFRPIRELRRRNALRSKAGFCKGTVYHRIQGMTA